MDKWILVIILSSAQGFSPRSTEVEELLDLLQSNIEDTRVKVKCSGVGTILEEKKCTEMSRNPELCKFSWLCGVGCRAACAQDGPGDILIQDIEQTACSVSWYLEDIFSSVLFIVVAQDGAGMWRIIEEGFTSRKLELGAPDSMKYNKIFVLVTSGIGVEDIRNFRIEESD